jgi:hypothetical protein
VGLSFLGEWACRGLAEARHYRERRLGPDCSGRRAHTQTPLGSNSKTALRHDELPGLRATDDFDHVADRVAGLDNALNELSRLSRIGDIDDRPIADDLHGRAWNRRCHFGAPLTHFH